MELRGFRGPRDQTRSQAAASVGRLPSARASELTSTSPSRAIGSAEKFCRGAEGSADLYPRVGRTMEWDTAAPQAVLEAAGGTLRLLDGGGPLLYSKPGWANPPFVCEGRPA